MQCIVIFYAWNILYIPCVVWNTQDKKVLIINSKI